MSAEFREDEKDREKRPLQSPIEPTDFESKEDARKAESEGSPNASGGTRVDRVIDWRSREYSQQMTDKYFPQATDEERPQLIEQGAQEAKPRERTELYQEVCTQQREILASTECLSRSERQQLFKNAVERLDDDPHIETFDNWAKASNEQRVEALDALGKRVQEEKGQRYVTHLDTEADLEGGTVGSERFKMGPAERLKGAGPGADVGGRMAYERAGEWLSSHYDVDINKRLSELGKEDNCRDAVKTLGHELTHTDQDEAYKRERGVGAEARYWPAPKAADYEEFQRYKQQPFEQDANTAGEDLAEALYQEIRRRKGRSPE
jgi:hypothetical protein